MHSKIINPRRDGRFVFANRTSSGKTVSYLGHEAREQDKETSFFNDKESDIRAEQVKEGIDTNTKGLRNHQEKFYSLVLSPSASELDHLGNDPQKLKSYTQQVMENYAGNFSLPNNKQLSSSDIIWFATIHNERKEKEGEQKGQIKNGNHTHIHVVVSARDKSGEHRLNPRGRKSHFTFKDWQVQNGKTFQQMFGYEKATVSEKLTQGMPEDQVERHRERIRYRIEYLNQYFVGSQKIDLDRALSIGKEQEYGKGFFFNLHRLTQNYQLGKLVHDPYQVLEKGKEDKITYPERSISNFAKSIQKLGQEAGEEDELLPERKKKRRHIDIEQER
jgi:hypothetical protein